MAYLNANERLALLEDLRKMSFNEAKWKLMRMDAQGRLSLIRNNQEVGRWLTRFDLRGLGTLVTLVEKRKHLGDTDGRHPVEYEMVEVIVEPMPDNQT